LNKGKARLPVRFTPREGHTLTVQVRGWLPTVSQVLSELGCVLGIYGVTGDTLYYASFNFEGPDKCKIAQSARHYSGKLWGVEETVEVPLKRGQVWINRSICNALKAQKLLIHVPCRKY
jgi:hypothetical protein